MKPSEMTELIALIRDAYPRQELRQGTLDVYGRMLGDLDYDAAMRAVQEHIASSQYFPTIADIRTRAARAAAGCPDPDQAWAEVVQQVRAVGARGLPVFSHRAITEAVRALGWSDYCHSDVADGATWRAQFRGFYEHACARATRAENVGRLEAAGRARAVLGVEVAPPPVQGPLKRDGAATREGSTPVLDLIRGGGERER